MGIYPNESDQDIEDRYDREEFRRLPPREQYHGFPTPLPKQETPDDRARRENALTQFAALSQMSRMVAQGGAS